MVFTILGMYPEKAARSKSVRFYMPCRILAVFVCTWSPQAQKHHQFVIGVLTNEHLMFRGS